MITLVQKIPKLTIFLIVGMTYFSAIANVGPEINPILKNYLALIPLQFLALGYVAYFYWLRGKK